MTQFIQAKKITNSRLTLIGGLLSLMLLCVSLSTYAQSYTVESVPSVYRTDTITYVSNPDNIINDRDHKQIDQILTNLQQKLTIDVAVVALGSIGQQNTRQFANELFDYWKISNKKYDNGLLILLVLDQREIVFETGYGLEGIMTDATSYRLQQNAMVPLLRQNKYSEGMLAGVQAVADYFYANQQQIKTEFDDSSSTGHPQETEAKNSQDEHGEISLLFAFIAIVGLLFVNNRLRKKDVDPKKIKLSSDLISIFLTILSLQLNEPVITIVYLLWYLGYYRRILVKAAISCPCCHAFNLKPLTLLEYEQYCDEKTLYELRIGARKLGSYQCRNCHHILHNNRETGRFSHCPACHTLAMQYNKSKTIRPATYTKTGLKIDCYQCIKCHHEIFEQQVIARKRPPESRSTPTFRSGSGSGSGSGFGSSSRSQGGRSSGGGRSGGGGASSKF